MKISMLGRALAALLLLCAATAAQAGGYYGGGGGSVTGGNCGSQQAANGVSSTGAPTGCLPVPIPHPGYASGQWYMGLNPISSVNSSGAPAVGTAYFSMLYVPAKLDGTNYTLSALGLSIQTVGTTTVQMALYKDDPTAVPHRPGALVTSTASVADTANPASGSATATLAPGWYWYGVAANDTTIRWRNKTTAGGGDAQMIGSAALITLAAGSPPTGVGASVTYGTWPATFVGQGTTWTETSSMATVPYLQFQ